MVNFTYESGVKYTDLIEYLFTMPAEWEGWPIIEQICRNMPGGDIYGKAHPDARVEDAWWKVLQYFINAHISESALVLLCNGLSFADNTHDTLHPGEGTNVADFIGDTGFYIDAKLYKDDKSLRANIVDSITNYNTRSKFLTKTCHKADRLLAWSYFDRTIYLVNLPKTVEETTEFIKNTADKPLQDCFQALTPKVMTTDQKVVFDSFKMLQIYADPSKTTNRARYI